MSKEQQTDQGITDVIRQACAWVVSESTQEPQGIAYLIDGNFLATSRAVVERARGDDDLVLIRFLDPGMTESVMATVYTEFDDGYTVLKLASRQNDREPLRLSQLGMEQAPWHAFSFQSTKNEFRADPVFGKIKEAPNDRLVLSVDDAVRGPAAEVLEGTPILVGTKVVGHLTDIDEDELISCRTRPDVRVECLRAQQATDPYRWRYHVYCDVERRVLELLDKDRGRAVLRWPEHTGKSWLLKRICDPERQPRRANTRYVEVSLDAGCTRMEELAWKFATQIADRLDGINQEILNGIWKQKAAPKTNLEEFMLRAVLERPDQVVVLVLDDVQNVFLSQNCGQLEGFFSLLRGWSQDATNPAWSRLRQLIAISTTQLYACKPNQKSGVGYSSYFDDEGNQIRAPRDVSLDFTDKQILELGSGQLERWSEGDTKAAMELVGGHPKFVQSIIWEVADGRPLDEVLADPVFREQNVRGIKDVLHTNPDKDILEALRKINPGSNVRPLDRQIYGRLVDAGLLINDGDDRCRLPYKLYEELIREL